VKSIYVFLVAVMLTGGASAQSSTIQWHASRHNRVRYAISPDEVTMFFAPSDVNYPYHVVAVAYVQPPQPKDGSQVFLTDLPKMRRRLLAEAGHYGAKGLIVSIPEVARFPPVCMADNYKDLPICERIPYLKATAIRPKH
jgi:hypothetical protein